MKISAVIPTNGERNGELRMITEHLHDIFDEVIVQKDAGSSIYSRYEGIQKAKNDIIYTQDDDCVISNIDELIDNYDKDGIVANYKAGSRAYYNRLCGGRVALIGYGSIFHKNLIERIEDFKKWLEDDKLFNREVDRVFTYLNKFKLIKGDIADFPSAYTGMFATTEHVETLNKIVKKLREYVK